jgi:hypothetical protein
MPQLFEDNIRELNEGVKLNLLKKVLLERGDCCIDAAKHKEKCKYDDTEDHKYRWRIVDAHNEVITVCELLCMVPVLMNSYSVGNLWRKYFNQSSYMKYHIESWYINVIRLEDMLLILVNEVFGLGIKKELVGYEVITTNTNVPERVRKNLKALHKGIKSIRGARIALIHHQTLYDSKLDEIRKDEELVRILREAGEGKRLEKELQMIEFFAKNFKVRNYRIDKRNSLLESNKSLLTFVSNFLRGLEKSFVERHDELLSGREDVVA